MTEFMNAIDKLDKSAGTMVDVKNYFEYPNSATFSKEWKALSEADKVDLKNGVGKGVGKDGTPPAGATLTY